MAGASGNDDVWVEGILSVLLLHVHGEDGHKATYAFDERTRTVSVVWLLAPEGVPGTGWGTKKFLELATAWQELEYLTVRIDPADGTPRTPDRTGYYFWPRVGFVGWMTWVQNRRLRPRWLGSTYGCRIEDLMLHVPGREAWRKYGSRLWNLTFDLNPGSESWKRLREYVGERASR